MAGCLALAAATVANAQPQSLAPQPQTAASPFEWTAVRDNVFIVSGPDGNMAVHVGPQGAVVVDTQRAELAPALVAELKKLVGERQIRFLINTSDDAGRTGANLEVRNAGRQVVGGMMSWATGDISKSAAHMAHENALLRLAAGGPGLGAPPSESYATDSYDFTLGGEPILLIHAKGHTDGDSMVFFRKSDVLVAGEAWNALTYPVIDVARGGSIEGELEALNTLIDIAISGPMADGGTMVIPGRGRVGDESNIVDYRNMLTVIRDRIKDMADKGMTLEQVKAAKPTEDYDGRYGATSGPWTTDMFVSAVYAGVKAQHSQSTKGSR